MSRPPTDITPARLFRLLSMGPRPRMPLDLRLDVDPDCQLYVVGLRGKEEFLAFDAAEGIEPDEARVSRILSELLVRALHTEDGPAFRSVDEMGGLEMPEWNALLSEAGAKLMVVSPFYARRSQDDTKAWDNVLEQGASHPSNMNEMVLMAQAVQYGFGKLTPRPDLYWGVPLCQLTDGQLMAYRAARDVYRKLTEHG